MTYTVEQYLEDFDAYTQDSPFENRIMFEVLVYDDCTGEYTQGVIWGEGINYVRQDLVRLLTDCQVIDEIINVF